METEAREKSATFLAAKKGWKESTFSTDWMPTILELRLFAKAFPSDKAVLAASRRRARSKVLVFFMPKDKESFADGFILVICSKARR